MDVQPDIDGLWDYSNPAETERKFRDLLPQVIQAGNQSYHAELLTQIARTLGLQRKFEAAHALLDEVETMLTSETPIVQIRYWLERGRVFNSSGDPVHAKPYFLQAWELGKQIEADYYAVDAAHMVAIAVYPSEEALDWNLKALAHAAGSDQPRARKWLGSLYNNIGWDYHSAGEYEKALEIFEKALEYRREQGAPGPIRIARWCIGRTLRSLKRVEEALSIQQELLVEVQDQPGEGGYTYEEMGECLLELGRAAEARPYFAQAYTLLSLDPWLVENESERLERLRALGSS